MTTRRRELTWTAVALAAVLWACADDGVTRPEAPQQAAAPVLLSRAGIPVPEPRMHELLERITREVAVALADPAVRDMVYKQLQASPYREHKLDFGAFLRSGTRPLLTSMAAARSAESGPAQSPGATVTTDAVLATLDSIIDLEFYMPVPTHWAAWRGDAHLLVAGALHDRAVPIGFDLAGRPVPLSADQPPDVPTLVVVRKETDFSSPSALARAAPARVTTVDPPGVYMVASYIADHGQYEGWTAGAPEFEVHAFVQNSVGTFVDVQCAGNEQSYPLQYDQNDDYWSGRVLAILEEGIGLHQVEFQVWEDDYQACTWNGGRPPHTTDNTAHDLENLAAKIFQAYIDSGIKKVASILMVVPGLLDLGFALNHDDPVGVFSLTGPQNGCFPVNGPATFDIKRPSDGANVGYVQLDVTFGDKVPKCPLAVSINGPGFVSAGSVATWDAVPVNGTQPYTYQWYINGSPVGTGPSYTGDVDGADFEISVTVTDAVGTQAGNSMYVTVSSCPPPQIICEE